MCIANYNPSSRKRADYLMKACDILLRHALVETVCGAVHNIAREGEEIRAGETARIQGGYAHHRLCGQQPDARD